LEINKIFGLPAHPLLVHAAVVLVPLAALAWIAIGWRQNWRRVYYLPLTLMAMGGAAATFLAKQSGEPLAQSVRQAGKRVGDHPEQGDTAFVFALLFALVCVVVLAWERYGTTLRQRFSLTSIRLPLDDDAILYAASVPIAALAVWFMVVAGHSGATLVWQTNR
jgi:hypothetical protein